MKEIWKVKFKKAIAKEFDVKDISENELELLKFKIDMSLDTGDEEQFKKLSEKLKSIESFLALSNA